MAACIAGRTRTFCLWDRVETVHFAHPGRYLVICGFLFHLNEMMFGYVKVNG